MIALCTDVALLTRLHTECFSDAWSADSFAALLGNAGCFALVDAEHCGFVLIQVVADQSEVLSLGVTPAARRRGIASQLLSEGLKQAGKRDALTMFLEVDCRNLPAIALYKALGFVEMGRRKAYYTTPDGGRSDALTLRTDIRVLLVGIDVQLG